MKKFIVPIILVVIVASAFRFAENTVTKSAIYFKIRNLGINTGGTIGGLQANVKFDPAKPETSSIEATVDVKTINTDNSTRDEHLRGENFLDAEKYPKITLKSTSIKRKSGDNYIGDFNLTMKAKTKQVQIPFTFAEKGNNQSFNGTFKINRRDYGVGSNSLTLSDDVTITIDVEVVK